MSGLLKTVDESVSKSLSFLDNEYVNAGLSLFLILYAGMVAPKLPNFLVKLFDNYIFKLLAFFLIVYLSKKDVTLAIIAAVAVMVSIMALNKIKLNENMASVMSEENGCNCNCKCNCSDCVCSDGSTAMPRQVVPQEMENEVANSSPVMAVSEEPLVMEQRFPIDNNLMMSGVPDVTGVSQEEVMGGVASIESDEVVGTEESPASVDFSELESTDSSLASQEEAMLAQQPMVTLQEESSNSVGGGYESVSEESAEEVQVEQEIMNLGEEANQAMVEEVMQIKAAEEAKGNSVTPEKLQFICKCVLQKHKGGNAGPSSPGGVEEESTLYASM
jgi:hypothetical protein